MTSKLCVALFLVVSSQSFAMNLQEYLKSVETHHKSIKALDVAKEAADDRNLAGDLELVPAMSAEVSYLSDKNPLSQFAMFGVPESKQLAYNLGFSKKFSSGTKASVWGAVTQFDNPGIVNPQFAAYSKFGYGQLGLTLSQSLWKDAFGHATRLRWERQDAATAAQKGDYDYKIRGVLVQAEAAFWEYLYAVENLKTAKGSLERAKKIESWTRRRVADGISDRADLLQGQALVAGRQLVLITAEDDLEAAKKAVLDALELKEMSSFPALEGDLSAARPLESLVSGGKGRVVQIEAYLKSLEAKVAAVQADEVEDSFRPDLVLSGSYNTNTFSKDMPDATQNLGDVDKPTAKVALTLNYMFDTSVKRAAKDASKKNALASRLLAERQLLESDSAWSELNRRYGEMNRRVQSAEQFNKLQNDRSRATNDLFNKGRTITMNVVDAENDAATSELNMNRLKAEQRKMEAQARLFMTVEE
ncbi:TolC family protein [Bdellovibrio sp. HCB185ZH]|uniref:TolC family protein n=1 Tax=Bdellovibrio sp. HCB185ZH TaxID=3394235 RepID=UPI0039A57978